MTSENREDQPATDPHPTQPQPALQPGLQTPPVPAAKKINKRVLLWGGGPGLVALALVVVLVIIPLFNRTGHTEADPFAVSKNLPAAITVIPVSGTAVLTNPTAAAPDPGNLTPLTSEGNVPNGGGMVQVFGRGDFTKIDAIHYARGTATVGVGAGGKKVLRFENFTSAHGPNLKVYLDTHSDGSQPEETGLDLGALPATDGSYNIALPDDVDLTKYKSVVIWCEAFSETFSVASLS